MGSRIWDTVLAGCHRQAFRSLGLLPRSGATHHAAVQVSRNVPSTSILCPRGTCSARHPEGSALESGEWLMSTCRCAANGAARSWISPIQVRASLDARSVLDLPGMRPPLLDHVSPAENGLCHPPAQWREGTLPSRRHLRRHVPECPGRCLERRDPGRAGRRSAMRRRQRHPQPTGDSTGWHASCRMKVCPSRTARL